MILQTVKSYGFRTCGICGETFEAHHWNQKYCSDDCRKEAKRRSGMKYRRQNPEKYRVWAKEYFMKNRERKLEYMREYARNHKEQYRKYRLDYYTRKVKPERCSRRHGGCDNCPYEDCIMP